MNVKRIEKQRLTAFVDPILIKRAKVRGALEGLTISEVVEKALDGYAPQIEKNTNTNINLKFANGPVIDTLISDIRLRDMRIAPKHSKHLVIPR